MDSAWEDLALSEDSEAVWKSGNVVLWSHIGWLNWFVTLHVNKGLGQGSLNI